MADKKNERLIENTAKYEGSSNGRETSYSVLGVEIVEFSPHADAQMKMRGITEAEVIRALKSPQETGLPTQIMRQRVRRYRGSKLAVDVVYEMRPDRVIVITAILKKFQ